MWRDASWRWRQRAAASAANQGQPPAEAGDQGEAGQKRLCFFLYVYVGKTAHGEIVAQSAIYGCAESFGPGGARALRLLAHVA